MVENQIRSLVLDVMDIYPGWGREEVIRTPIRSLVFFRTRGKPGPEDAQAMWARYCRARGLGPDGKPRG